MAFTPPEFNVLCDIWYGARRPNDGAPDFDDQPCQFYITNKGNPLMDPPPFTFFPPAIYLRMPFADNVQWENGTIFEVPPSSGYYYRATFKDRMHLGFPNQYRIVLLYACDGAGTAITRFVDTSSSGTSHAGAGEGDSSVQVTASGTAFNSVENTANGEGTSNVTCSADGLATH